MRLAGPTTVFFKNGAFQQKGQKCAKCIGKVYKAIHDITSLGFLMFLRIFVYSWQFESSRFVEMHCFVGADLHHDLRILAFARGRRATEPRGGPTRPVNPCQRGKGGPS